MKNFKAFAETDIVEMENNFNDKELTIATFNKIINVRAYIMDNSTNDLLITYDEYDFFDDINMILWANLDFVY